MLFPLPKILPAGAFQLDLVGLAQVNEEGHGRPSVGSSQLFVGVLDTQRLAISGRNMSWRSVV
jgi:hypothetical protein